MEIAVLIFCCKQKTAYDLRSSDWSSDVCSSELTRGLRTDRTALAGASRGQPVPGPEPRHRHQIRVRRAGAGACAVGGAGDAEPTARRAFAARLLPARG